MSRLKRALAADEPVFGMITGAASAQIVELCGWLGYDFVLLDMEHGDGLDVSSVLPLIRAADASGVEVIVRVARFDAGIIQNLLDCGADGICVPHVQTRAHAERAARATRYPPDGDRGMHPFVRSTEWTTSLSWAEYWPKANAEITVMVIVEEASGIDNLDEIASAPGIDVLWIGTGDLSQSLGVPFGSPELLEAQTRGLEASKRNGLAPFTPLPSSVLVDRETRQSMFREAVDEGYRVFAALDASVYVSGFKELLEAVRDA